MFDLKKEYEYPGMIDWLSLSLDVCFVPEPLRLQMEKYSNKIMLISPDGEIKSIRCAWDSIRSDTHQIVFRIGSRLEIQGSPSRVGLLNNAFGSLDIHYCAEKMISFVLSQFGFPREALPPLPEWGCTRIDITRNLCMTSREEPGQVLESLKYLPSGRQKVSFEVSGIYIGKGSSHLVGKVYLKGQDAKRLNARKKSFYTEEELLLSDYLLRFELMLRSRKIKHFSNLFNCHWSGFTPEFLLTRHDEFFSKYLSDAEILDMNMLLEKLIEVAKVSGKSEAAARQAYGFYLLVRQNGLANARASTTKTTFYRHKKLLQDAGVMASDLVQSNVLPIRRKPILLGDAVCSWEDVRQRIAALKAA